MEAFVPELNPVLFGSVMEPGHVILIAILAITS